MTRTAVDTHSDGPVLILTALDLEYQAVRAHLTELRSRSHREGTLFETGSLPGGRSEITIAVIGEGNPGAAVLAERAITTYQPRALMLVGVAGALKDDINLGDVVVATKVYAYQGGKDEQKGFLARPNAWDAPHALEQLARHISRTMAWAQYLPENQADDLPPVHFKPVVSGEVVLNSRDTPLAEFLRTNFNDAAAIEMESAGMAQACHLNSSRPVLTIRGVSDKADGTKHATDDSSWQPRAAAHAAAFAIALAVELLNGGTGHAGDVDAQPLGMLDDAAEPRSNMTQDNTASSRGVVIAAQGGSVHISSAPGQQKEMQMPVEDELAALAAAGAGALVTAMATDAWKSMRDAVAALFRRANPGRHHAINVQLEEDASLVAGAHDPAKTRAAVEGMWEQRLTALLIADPGYAPELQALIRRFAETSGKTQRMKQTNTARDSGTVFAAQQGNVYVYPADASPARPPFGGADSLGSGEEQTRN
jgi:8-oxo-dGTP diphosphatase